MDCVMKYVYVQTHEQRSFTLSTTSAGNTQRMELTLTEHSRITHLLLPLDRWMAFI